jgi:hypothetical protein
MQPLEVGQKTKQKIRKGPKRSNGVVLRLEDPGALERDMYLADRRRFQNWQDQMQVVCRDPHNQRLSNDLPSHSGCAPRG